MAFPIRSCCACISRRSVSSTCTRTPSSTELSVRATSATRAASDTSAAASSAAARAARASRSSPRCDLSRAMSSWTSSSAPASSCRITSTSTPPPTACACSRFASASAATQPRRTSARQPPTAERASQPRPSCASSWVRRSWRARGSMPSGPRLRRASSSSAVRIRTARRRSSRFSRRSWRAAAALSGALASASPPPVLRASSRICSSRLGESAPPARAFAGDLLGERERVGRTGDDSCSTPATISHATAGPVSRSCFIVRASTTARSTFAFRRHDSHRVWSGFSRSKRFEHDAQNALCVEAYTCSSEGLTLTRARRRSTAAWRAARGRGRGCRSAGAGVRACRRRLRCLRIALSQNCAASQAWTAAQNSLLVGYTARV